jgi:hypothetical protein
VWPGEGRRVRCRRAVRAATGKAAGAAGKARADGINSAAVSDGMREIGEEMREFETERR